MKAVRHVDMLLGDRFDHDQASATPKVKVSATFARRLEKRSILFL